jgi:hypothetical protein
MTPRSMVPINIEPSKMTSWSLGGFNFGKKEETSDKSN